MDQFEELLAKLQPRVREAFFRAISEVVDTVILQQVITAIEIGDVEGAFRALGITPPVFFPLVNVVTEAVNTSGIAIMAQFPKYLADSQGVKTPLRFNIRDPLAEAWLRNESSTLITGIENDMRAAVRSAMDEGLQAGRNPRNVALDIVGRVDRTTGKRTGGILGLGAREQEWSRRVRVKLNTLDASYFEMELRDKRFDGTVARAIADQKPLNKSDIDKLVDRYRDIALKYRGDQIARTETLGALNYSEWLSIKQALETGELPESAVKKYWDSAGDTRVRPSHVALDGQVRGFNEPFISPVTGARMMQPGDRGNGASGKDVIGCRCRVRYEVDWAAGVD